MSEQEKRLAPLPQCEPGLVTEDRYYNNGRDSQPPRNKIGPSDNDTDSCDKTMSRHCRTTPHSLGSSVFVDGGGWYTKTVEGHFMLVATTPQTSTYVPSRGLLPFEKGETLKSHLFFKRRIREVVAGATPTPPNGLGAYRGVGKTIPNSTELKNGKVLWM